MLAPDETSDQSFTLFYENGKVRLDHSRSANEATLILMTRCFERMMQQVIGRAVRPAGDPPISAGPQMTAPPAESYVPSPPALEPAPKPLESSCDGLWLSDAIDDWLKNGGTTFSDLSWKHSYEPWFRVFRELVGEQRRDHTAADGTYESASSTSS